MLTGGVVAQSLTRAANVFAGRRSADAWAGGKEPSLLT